MPHFDSQSPASFGWPTPPQGSFEPFSYSGHSFPQGIAVGTDRIFRTALDRLCAQPGFRLPDSTGLDAGCWGQSTRRKTSGNGWSFHAYGLALDIAAPWNPYGSARPPAHPYRLPENTQELVRPLGLLWGASFDDWMHLECHLSPTEVADLDRELAAGASRSEPSSPQGGGPPFPLPPGYYYGPRSGPLESVSNLWNPDPVRRAGLQAAQLKLGCHADGLYGPVTRAAIQLWQGEHGLQVDGLLGPDTWRSLFG